MERSGGSENFKWTGKFENVRPGDIVQFKDVELAGYTDTGTYTAQARHHSAVVYGVNKEEGILKILSPELQRPQSRDDRPRAAWPTCKRVDSPSITRCRRHADSSCAGQLALACGSINCRDTSSEVDLMRGTIIWTIGAVWRQHLWVALAQVPYLIRVSIATVLQQLSSDRSSESIACQNGAEYAKSFCSTQPAERP